MELIFKTSRTFLVIYLLGDLKGFLFFFNFNIHGTQWSKNTFNSTHKFHASLPQNISFG